MVSESWGLLHGHEQKSKSVFWREDAYMIFKEQFPLLAYGLGRSYGDVCLPETGTLLHTRTLDKIRAFDAQTGRISCEAGVSFDEILQFIVPRGWFLPVTPGTKFVTLGGAIANDIHGKNHHRRGTIGRHILEFELVRSTGEVLVCSPEQEKALFAATIGGMGLTGLITWASLQLIPIKSAFIDTETIKMENLDHFFELDSESEKDFEYTVSWIDCMAKDRKLGRGLFMRGNHATGSDPKADFRSQGGPKVTIPFHAPEFLLNGLSIRAFNFLYYHKQFKPRSHKKQGIDPFFYPLDAVNHWNRLYGRRGMLQYQCVVPMDAKEDLRLLFETIAKSGQGSFLGVLKRFGSVPSPGQMSFPFEGYTLALDFCNLHERSRELFEELDSIVTKAGGRLYAAKDALMSAKTFQTSYPQWKEFQEFIDPNFQSMFWKRVSARV